MFSRIFTSALIVSACAAIEIDTESSRTHKQRESVIDDNCCTVYFPGGGRWRHNFEEFCLDITQDVETAFSIYASSLSQKTHDAVSVKCGKGVDATICPSSFEIGPETHLRELTHTCLRDNNLKSESGVKVGANQELDEVPIASRQASIILKKHIWVAKGVHYLSLDREDKADILMGKLLEDDTKGDAIGAIEGTVMFAARHADDVFDENGDEFDCRREKTVHSQGNVGKVQWVSVGDHAYTGMFKGADTGFVRLSTNFPMVDPPDLAVGRMINMNPTMAVKLLRDGMDSANAFGNMSIYGQASYNFFAGSLNSHATNDDNENIPFDMFANPNLLNTTPATPFILSVGHSDMATFTQDGERVSDPVFPFTLRYEPADDFGFPHTKPEGFDPQETPFEQLRSVPIGSTLYKVLARAEPGSEEEHIADIVLESTLETSLWGDKNMFFRHQRHDDDVRYHPEWAEHLQSMVLPNFIGVTPALQLMPVRERRATECPFAFLFSQ